MHTARVKSMYLHASDLSPPGGQRKRGGSTIVGGLVCGFRFLLFHQSSYSVHKLCIGVLSSLSSCRHRALCTTSFMLWAGVLTLLNFASSLAIWLRVGDNDDDHVNGQHKDDYNPPVGLLLYTCANNAPAPQTCVIRNRPNWAARTTTLHSHIKTKI